MWVEHIVVEGFRRLHGTFEFSPGLTVVVGPNEAGKSSLQEALVRALHGYSKSDRRRSRGASLRDRYAPWEGDRTYTLVARLRDGERMYDIEWDFASHTVQLTDERGRDLTDEVVRRGDTVELGQFLFGIGLDDFRQVCCIDQDALLAVCQSPSLGVALQEAVANVAGNVAVEDAVGRLNEFLKTVGARTDTLRPTPTGRLNALASDAEKLRETITDSAAAREQLVAVSAERARLRAEQDERLAERERVRQRQLLSEAEALRSRLEEAQALERAAAERPATKTSFDESLVDEVKSARDQLAETEERIVAARREAEAAEPEVARLEAEQRRLVPLVDGLQLYADVDTSQEAAVRAASAALAENPAGAPARADAPARDPALARYRSERPGLLALERPAAHPRLRHAAWIVLVVLSIGIAWGIRKLFRRYRPKRQSPLGERLAAYGAATLDELDRRCAEEDANAAAFQALLEAHAEQERASATRRTQLAGALEAALDTAGAPAAPTDERVVAYLAGCERHSELVERQAELDRVRRELAEAARPRETLERLAREREQTEARVRTAYSTLAIDEPSLDNARQRLDELIALTARERKAVHDADAARKALVSVLGDDTIDMLKAKYGAAQRQLDADVAAHGTTAESPGDPGELAEQLAALEESLRQQERRLAELETTARSLEEAVGDPAAVKEQLAAVETEHEHLIEARDAVGLARSVLLEAADELSREFAPHLNEALCRNLGRITGGRYHEARVDSDLTVKVIVPETGQVVSADDLSRATKDQIFLVERLEIARLLAPTKGTAPLLLDDPFAHYDHTRLRYGLEILAETAESRQVILFSEDPDIAALAEDVCPQCTILELAAPPVPAITV